MSQYYINPAGGGHPTYTTLASCIDYITNNDDPLTEICNIEIQGDWSESSDTTAVQISSITTAADKYINIYTDGSNRPERAGINSNKYVLAVNNAAYAIQGSYTNHWRVDGLQIQHTAATNGTTIGISTCSAGAFAQITNCYVMAEAASSQVINHVSMADADATWKIWNCIFYVGTSNAGDIDAAYFQCSGSSSVYNCTFSGGHRRGLRYATDDTVNLYEVVIFGTTNDDFYNRTNWLEVIGCAHDDAAVTGETYEVTGHSADAWWTSDYADAQYGNFNLVAASVLIAGGQGNLASDEGVTTDIQGSSRTSQELGATAYIAAGGDPEAALIMGKLIRGGLLLGRRLV